MYELTNHDTTTAGQKPGILATWLQKHVGGSQDGGSSYGAQ